MESVGASKHRGFLLYSTTEPSASHLEKLKDVEADVKVREFRVEDFEIGVVDVLEDDGRRLGLRSERSQQ